MFYEGTLQDGISTAVGQQKLVLCFVTDDGEESNLWENEFLVDESDHAVALRLKAGSDEAGYLAQIFPLPRTPTVVIIKNGELKEYITSETSKDEFLRRVQTSFSAPTSPAQPAPASAPQSEPAPNTSSLPPISAPGEPDTSENVRRVLAERAKLKAEKEKEEAERKQKEELAKAKGKAKADPEPKADAITDNDQAHKAAEAVRKRRQQEQEERRRILQRIEDDKAERKMKAAEREQQRLEDMKSGDSATPLANAPQRRMSSSAKKLSDTTALQVRLFDGSTLRNRFKTETLLKEVRAWVDENRNDGTQPYTFKQMLAPMPNKNIDATEETKSVGDLGLSPSSTLVLIPVQKYSSAYDGSSQSVLSKVIGFFLGILWWFLGLFTSGEGQGATGAPVASTQAQETSQDRSRIHRFQNQNDRLRDQQLYNGNSLNFESRPDEDDKDD